ncbi:RNA polymerase subunit sigma [Acidovorax sp. Root275]|uniref:sigma-70 family RNA polymerase sigma factor n=1 Tax=Acidovorax sp. Root275 TaxID=1736508 RepID=UPI00070FDFC4|nr:sigma-70 family RNA polymerase sigma factor [Acidovorax sp. Root275]KRD42379.1 RNA polymerase subunit sigma [Acidovorax sp. Root275]
MEIVEERLRGLLLQGLDADAAAYQRFLKELSAHLRAFLRRRLMQRPDEVEDLVQETLLAVHNQRHTYRPEMPVTAWAHAIARYKLIDWLRSHAVKEGRNDPLDDADELFASSDSEAAEARRDLGQLLRTLPDKQRLPIECVKLEGLSVVETARLTGLSESAVKVGVHRGLKALAAKIRDMTYVQQGSGKPPGTEGRSLLHSDVRKSQGK